MNLTLPEKLLHDLQQEAERSNRSVSEVVTMTIEEAWHSSETKLDALGQQMTQLTEKVEVELATLRDIVSRLRDEFQALPAVLDKMVAKGDKTTTPEPQKIATYEEMYGPIPHTPPATPPPPPLPPPQRRWPWNS